MKQILLLLVLLFAHSVTNAQSSFYFKIGSGYAFPFPANTIGINEEQTYRKDTDPTSGNYVPTIIFKETAVNGSYGAGLPLTGSVGYNISKFLQVELNVGYISGNQYKTASIDQETIDGKLDNSSEETQKKRANSLTFSPVVIITSGEKNIRPYLLAGPIAGSIKMKTEYRYSSSFDDDFPDREINETFSGGIAFGFRGGAGADIKLTRAISLFIEAGFTSMKYSPLKKEVTRFVIDGDDELRALRPNQREVRFEKTFTVDTSSPSYNDTNAPAKESRFTREMSNFNMTTGLKVSL